MSSMKATRYALGIAGIGFVLTCGAIHTARAQEVGTEGSIVSGTCADLGDEVAALGQTTVAPGERVGSSKALAAASSFSSAPLTLNALIQKEYSILIVDPAGKKLACGEIGGAFSADGSLVMGIKPLGSSGVNGAAYLAALSTDPSQTGISLFLTGQKLVPTASTPAKTNSASVATATPTSAEKMAAYTWLADVRELAIRPGTMIGDEFAFSGTIMTIQVATPGDAFLLGDQELQSFEAVIQVSVLAPDGSSEFVTVGYNGDTSGMYEGTWVSVYGTAVGTRSGTNRLGGQISQPLVKAEFVVIG